jgi:hypothetical protein
MPDEPTTRSTRHRQADQGTRRRQQGRVRDKGDSVRPRHQDLRRVPENALACTEVSDLAPELALDLLGGAERTEVSGCTPRLR